MANISINDVLATSYLSVKNPPEMTKANTALLLIDIQNLATPEYLAKSAIEAGLDKDGVERALADYEERFHSAVKNCTRLLNAVRQSGVVPIHIKIQSLSGDARDTGAMHRRLGWQFPPNAYATQFMDEVSPKDGEIVITKTASGAFSGTSLDRTLRNMRIEHVLICGFVTDECVETTSRVAVDLGYVVKIVADATTTYHREAAEFTLAKFGAFGLTATTNALVATLQNLP